MPPNNYIKALERTFISTKRQQHATIDAVEDQIELMKQRIELGQQPYHFFDDRDESQCFLAQEFAALNDGKLVSCFADYPARPTSIKVIGAPSK